MVHLEQSNNSRTHDSPHLSRSTTRSGTNNLPSRNQRFLRGKGRTLLRTGRTNSNFSRIHERNIRTHHYHHTSTVRIHPTTRKGHQNVQSQTSRNERRI